MSFQTGCLKGNVATALLLIAAFSSTGALSHNRGHNRGHNQAKGSSKASTAALVKPAQEERYEFSQPHMGTLFKIVLYARNREIATSASDAAFDRVRQVDSIMSDYRETSELMLLSKQAGNPTPIKTSDDLFHILSVSQKIARETGGAFDATVGPVVRLWRRARRTLTMPDPQRLTQALDLTGYRKMHLDEKDKSVRLEKSGMLLDLGGIAKGYAADQALLTLKKHNIKSALVAAAGDIVVSEAPPPPPPPPLPATQQQSRGWIIGIAELTSRDGSSSRLPPKYLELRNAAVSTSGDAEQYVEIGGTRYSHIVDPRTGLGVTGRSSVTVVADCGTTTDALATAASVLGPQGSLPLIDSMKGVAALIVQATENGRLRTFESKGWRFVPQGKSRDTKQSDTILTKS